MRKSSDKLAWLAKVAANPNITPAQFKVAFCLVDHLNCKTQQCNPSISRLAGMAGVQIRAVQRTIKILESERLLFVTRVRGGDKNLTNSFKFIQTRAVTGPTPVPTDTSVPTDTRVPTDALPLSPGTPKTVNRNNKEKIYKKERPHFVKPTPYQVAEYAASIDFAIDGQYFCDSYEAKDWMIGKARMKDWKAAVRTWKCRDKKNETNRPNSNNNAKRETLGERTARRLGIIG